MTAPAVTAPAAAVSSGAVPSAAVSSGATSGQAAVVVSYVVDSRGADGFQAEVDVSNNGSSSISGWQIVVALPDDQVTSVQGATGYVSHHILLLSQAPSSPAIAPRTTVRVFFTAQGVKTTPELCAFNNVACG
jgi:cellulase/cellobiase CelA1